MRTLGRAKVRIRSAERALELIEVLVGSGEPLALSEISRKMKVAPATSHHLLSTLMHLGYVQQDLPARRYRLGMGMVHLAARVLKQAELMREAIPVMRHFAEATGERITLATLSGDAVSPLHTEDAPEAPRLFVHFGRRAPLHSTALGKVLLAWRAEGDVLRALGSEPLTKFTLRTITTHRRFLRELARVRRERIAVDNEETLLGARCLAVPVRNHRGEVIAALSASGPVGAWTPTRMARLRALLQAAGEMLSQQLGYGRRPSREKREVS